MEIKTCPTCGGEVKDDLSMVERVRLLGVGGLAGATFEIIARTGGVVSTDAIVKYVYRGAREPKAAARNIHVSVHKHRHKLAKVGLELVGHTGRIGGYSMRRIGI